MRMAGKSSSRWLLVKLSKDSDSCGCSTDTQAKDTQRHCVVVGHRSALRRLLDHGDQGQSSSSTYPITASTETGNSKKHRTKIREGKNSTKKSSKKIRDKASENNSEEPVLIEELPRDNSVLQDNLGVSEPIQVSKRPASSDVPTQTNYKSAPAVLVSQAQHCRHKLGPAVTQVQWAFTKVTYFSDDTRVYEVRKPSTEAPKDVPHANATHGFFVTMPTSKKCSPHAKSQHKCNNYTTQHYL